LTRVGTEALQAFLREHVSSFEELETLLLLARGPHRSWSVQELAAALKLGQDNVQVALDGLLAAGNLVEVSTTPSGIGAYHCAPPPALQPLLERLRVAYDEERVLILQLMTTNALQRVRSAAAHRLADAFRLQRDKK
jgi:DNA-binding MarR family transcriptional regulator